MVVSETAHCRPSRQNIVKKKYTLPVGEIAASIEYAAVIHDTLAAISSIDGDELKSTSRTYCYTVCYEPCAITLDLRLDTTLFDKPLQEN